MHAGLALWVTDRLYEANAEEMIPGIGDNAMAVPDTGKWTALAVLIGMQLGWGARGFFRPTRLRLQAVQMDKTNLEPPTLESASRKRKETDEVVTHLTKVCPASYISSSLPVVCQAFVMSAIATAFHMQTRQSCQDPSAILTAAVNTHICVASF